MNINDLKTIAQLEQFLTGTQPIAFMVASGQVDIYLDYSGPQKTDSTIRWCLSKKVGQNE